MITLTDNAVKQLQNSLAEQGADGGMGLRIFVEKGGCAGLQYGMRFEAQAEGDHEFGRDGVRLLVDPESLEFLDGAQVDYSDALTGGGFKILNPNAARSCGCGTSFEKAETAAGQ